MPGRPHVALLLSISAAVTLGCAEKQPPLRADPETMQPRKLQMERERPDEVGVVRNGVAGEVPAQILAAIGDDLARRAPGLEATLVVAESVIWPDGSMGCGQPGQNYTMQLVPGYRVVFEAGGRRWNYHSNEGGRFVFCKRPTARPYRTSPAE